MLQISLWCKYKFTHIKNCPCTTCKCLNSTSLRFLRLRILSFLCSLKLHLRGVFSDKKQTVSKVRNFTPTTLKIRNENALCNAHM